MKVEFNAREVGPGQWSGEFTITENGEELGASSFEGVTLLEALMESHGEVEVAMAEREQERQMAAAEIQAAEGDDDV